MPLRLDDTIAAIASPPGAGQRGLIRVSGPDALRIAAMIFTPAETAPDLNGTSQRFPHRSEGRLLVPSVGIAIPAALMTWPTGRSFTGQPMTEVHLIGSPPLLDATLERLLECGARAAGRGEFTMRAFLAGRIDLVQAEAVLGVIDAADHDELQTALTQLGGAVTGRLRQIRTDLIAILGDLEAGLDFVDEDIEFISSDQLTARLQNALQTVQQLADDSTSRLPSGYRPRVVLAGLPNAGKSTLFNRLAGTDKAMVSAIPGTTRDYLTTPVHLPSLTIELIDTAGWEAAADLIMRQAQQRRGEQLQMCDLILWCRSAMNPSSEAETDQILLHDVRSQGTPILQLQTQCDLAPDEVITEAVCDVRVSARSGEGLAELCERIEGTLSRSRASRGELLGVTAVRCRDSLRQARNALQLAIAAAEQGVGDELISVEIRQCLHALGTILGEVYTDDILDHIFSSFCIGK